MVRKTGRHPLRLGQDENTRKEHVSAFFRCKCVCRRAWVWVCARQSASVSLSLCVCVRAEVCARTRGRLSCVLLVLRCFLWFFPRFCFFVCFDVCVRWRLVSLLVCWLYYMFYNSIFVRVVLFCLCTWRGVWMFACLCLCLLCFSFVLHVFLRVSVCVCVSKT